MPLHLYMVWWSGWRTALAINCFGNWLPGVHKDKMNVSWVIRLLNRTALGVKMFWNKRQWPCWLQHLALTDNGVYRHTA